MPCAEATPYPGSGTTEVSAVLTGLTVGTNYHYIVEAANASGSNFGGNRRLEAKAVLDLETKPATEVDEDSAVLHGQLDADGLATTYYFEYGRTTSYGLKTASQPVNGAPGEIKPTPFSLGHLQRGKEYHYRIVATNGLGTTRGTDFSFRTASSPEISGIGSENVTDTSADVNATINPVGFDTTYRFEYGTTPSYGQTAGEGELTGNIPQDVGSTGRAAGRIDDSLPGRRENEWGTSVTDDTTFNFRPPACPELTRAPADRLELPAGLPCL